MKKKIAILIAVLTAIAITVIWALPAFATSYVATLIPGQPLSVIAAEQIILHSGLPKEKLPDGTENKLTKCRDAVNAYRYAHTQMSTNGWYRGLSEDHGVLLDAMVVEMENNDYKSDKTYKEDKTADVLDKFWKDSDNQNAVELGYTSADSLHLELKSLRDNGKDADAVSLKSTWENKWK